MVDNFMSAGTNGDADDEMPAPYGTGPKNRTTEEHHRSDYSYAEPETTGDGWNDRSTALDGLDPSPSLPNAPRNYERGPVPQQPYVPKPPFLPGPPPPAPERGNYPPAQYGESQRPGYYSETSQDRYDESPFAPSSYQEPAAPSYQEPGSPFRPSAPQGQQQPPAPPQQNRPSPFASGPGQGNTGQIPVQGQPGPGQPAQGHSQGQPVQGQHPSQGPGNNGVPPSRPGPPPAQGPAVAPRPSAPPPSSNGGGGNGNGGNGLTQHGSNGTSSSNGWSSPAPAQSTPPPPPPPAPPSSYSQQAPTQPSRSNGLSSHAPGSNGLTSNSPGSHPPGSNGINSSGLGSNGSGSSGPGADGFRSNGVGADGLRSGPPTAGAGSNGPPQPGPGNPARPPVQSRPGQAPAQNTQPLPTLPTNTSNSATNGYPSDPSAEYEINSPVSDSRPGSESPISERRIGARRRADVQQDAPSQVANDAAGSHRAGRRGQPTASISGDSSTAASTGSGSPAGPADGSKRPRKYRVHHLREMKNRGEKWAMLTAYDQYTAEIFDQAGIPVLLVGDSAANNVFGYDTTLRVTVDELIPLARAVANAVDRALVVADLPFGSYQASPEQAFHTAVRFMKEAGVHAVKLEGGRTVVPAVEKLTQSGIPVMAHIGFTPQSEHSIGGYRVQGRGDQAAGLIDDAVALAEAGAFSVVLEMVPGEVAAEITKRISVPTIGIGAGRDTDAQVLVWQDMAGLRSGPMPRFVKQYADLRGILTSAATTYAAEVASGSFPTDEHTF
ncbi:MAG TPA: 3-methyl-2-oxobutanoate hydroxymethyltransferase [Kribbella sp.]|uniref:3-methyl-2-oxobutanoate hydroxymethyltransferase n=1 Tax=Kribbella sp. TaxID=1871183 RepID=UPI002D79D4C4|nr:3-methyl-2-oxobutanoate hydroxymethyltransferase [Kribbella sp.]HET6295489.1 3-methyl-2-oxobutanoate hydroxymethyltransferase [Kribbella sp.]